MTRRYYGEYHPDLDNEIDRLREEKHMGKEDRKLDTRPVTDDRGRIIGHVLVDPPTLRELTMDNQKKDHEGLPVKGYQKQSDENVQLVNRNKELEETLLRVLDSMRREPQFDQRWLAIGRTHIEEGFMAINRAVFKPNRVVLPGDDPEPVA